MLSFSSYEKHIYIYLPLLLLFLCRVLKKKKKKKEKSWKETQGCECSYGLKKKKRKIKKKTKKERKDKNCMLYWCSAAWGVCISYFISMNLSCLKTFVSFSFWNYLHIVCFFLNQVQMWLTSTWKKTNIYTDITARVDTFNKAHMLSFGQQWIWNYLHIGLFCVFYRSKWDSLQLQQYEHFRLTELRLWRQHDGQCHPAVLHRRWHCCPLLYAGKYTWIFVCICRLFCECVSYSYVRGVSLEVCIWCVCICVLVYRLFCECMCLVRNFLVVNLYSCTYNVCVSVIL